jgi:hypothetical protein
MKKATDSNSNKTLHFDVPEFSFSEKGLAWYGRILLFFGLVVLAAVWVNDIRLAVIMIIAAAVFYHLATVTPKRAEVVFSPEGVTFQDRFRTWSEFKSFTLIGDAKHMVAYLDYLSPFSGVLVLPLPKKHSADKANTNH